MELFAYYIPKYGNRKVCSLANNFKASFILVKRTGYVQECLNLLKSVIAGVHDSFWTHACDVDKMNQILREKFVELYSMPILENVSMLEDYISCLLRLLHIFSLLSLLTFW